eukprot:TRINITY_DN2408_c0_g4_i1.p1 TRINITY_DN2408_c0_g4~~TRINITY_DN2408_c0_g4_i1.p1  ORF type:complete len:254 (-),score=62.49 TRINITY_DN2408_c0_g4_i1:123-836(-)
MATRASLLVLFVVAVVFCIGCAQAVEILTDSNFDAKVNPASKETWFVKFYAPWCGHCKRLALTWDQLGEVLASSSARVGKVDCTIEKAICKRYGIRGFPTLIMLDPANGKMYPYNSGRSLNDLVSFAQYEDGTWRRSSANSIPDPNAEPPVGEFGKDMAAIMTLFERQFGFSIFWLVGVLGSLFVLLIVVMCIFICSSDDAEVATKKSKKESSAGSDDNDNVSSSSSTVDPTKAKGD